MCGARLQTQVPSPMAQSFAESTSCCVWCASWAWLSSCSHPTDAENAPQPYRTGSCIHLRDDTTMRLPRQMQHADPAAPVDAAPSQQVRRLPARETSSAGAVERHSTTEGLRVDGSCRECTTMQLPRQMQHADPAAPVDAAPSQQVGRLPARETSSASAVERHSTTEGLRVDRSCREGTTSVPSADVVNGEQIVDALLATCDPLSAHEVPWAAMWAYPSISQHLELPFLCTVAEEAMARASNPEGMLAPRAYCSHTSFLVTRILMNSSFASLWRHVRSYMQVDMSATLPTAAVFGSRCIRILPTLPMAFREQAIEAAQNCVRLSFHAPLAAALAHGEPRDAPSCVMRLSQLFSSSRHLFPLEMTIEQMTGLICFQMHLTLLTAQAERAMHTESATSTTTDPSVEMSDGVVVTSSTGHGASIVQREVCDVHPLHTRQRCVGLLCPLTWLLRVSYRIDARSRYNGASM
jgi:hypothetical protein